jgi:hypothetical protein
MVICSPEVESKIALERLSTARFANGIAKSGDLQSSAVRSISSAQGTRVSLMGDIIALLNACSCSPGHNFDYQRVRVFKCFRSALEVNNARG